MYDYAHSSLERTFNPMRYTGYMYISSHTHTHKHTNTHTKTHRHTHTNTHTHTHTKHTMLTWTTG